MTADDFRELALSFDDSMEGAHMGHPDFRANGRIFATLAPGETRGMVKLTAEEQQEFLRGNPKMFEPASGAWGRQGWTTATLSKLKPAELKAALETAWQHAVPKQPKKRGKVRSIK